LNNDGGYTKNKEFKENTLPVLEKAMSVYTEMKEYIHNNKTLNIADNRYYYFEESVRREIDKLDDMYDIVVNNKNLRALRKEAYAILFSLHHSLDTYTEEGSKKVMMFNEFRDFETRHASLLERINSLVTERTL